MTTKLRPQIADYSHLKPLPDPPPRPPGFQAADLIYNFRSILSLRLGRRDDVLIAGGGYLRQRPYDHREQFVPDLVVAFGVNPDGIIARNGYVISEVGKPPDLILEAASYNFRNDNVEDYTVKREGYAAYGVREYWRFDYTGGLYYDTALAGDTLVGDHYQPLPIHADPDGLIWGYSSVLSLEICWEEGNVQLRNHHTKELLPTPQQARHMQDATTL